MIVPETVKFTKEIKVVCTDKDILIFVVPSVFVRSTARMVNPYIKTGQIIVDVAKGIESNTLLSLTIVIGDELDAEAKLVALPGLTHAEEVAHDLSSANVSACRNIAIAEKSVKRFYEL